MLCGRDDIVVPLCWIVSVGVCERVCGQYVRVCVCVQYIPCLVVIEGIKKRLKSLATIISGPVTWPAPWAAFNAHL